MKDTKNFVCTPGQLDASQRAAVEFVLKQPDICVLHGPPGTGKTTTLVEVVRQHLRLGLKVRHRAIRP